MMISFLGLMMMSLFLGINALINLFLGINDDDLLLGINDA